MPQFNTAIIGGGPAGVFAAIFASKNPQNFITIYEKNDILKTLLPTGGGRCNLAHAESGIRELAANFPRGEKFLYSVFSKFSTSDTLEFFQNIGIKTYTQEDMRIFPKSNSAPQVRDALAEVIKSAPNIKIVRQEAKNIQIDNGKFLVFTENGSQKYDALVIATGGKGLGHKFAQKLGHTVTPLKPALTGLKIKEKIFTELAGVSLKNVSASVPSENIKKITGDLLFTHNGISGPLAFKISSFCAYADYGENAPLAVKLKKLEFGTSTGRQRMVGWFDAVEKGDALRYGGYDDIAINKLDALSYSDEWQGGELLVCTHYRDSETGVDYYGVPRDDSLRRRLRPVYAQLKCWSQDISGVRKFDDLPEEAKRYIAFCMKSIIDVASKNKSLKNLPNLRYIGVGPLQSQIIRDVPRTEELLKLL